MRRFKHAAFAAAFLALSAAAIAADTPAAMPSDAVIFPKGTPEQRARAAKSEDDSGSTLILVLLATGALAGAGFYLLRKGGLPKNASTQGNRLAIEETRPLGNKQFLAVASYGDQKFLLSVCQGRIDLLSRLDGKPSSDASEKKAEL